MSLCIHAENCTYAHTGTPKLSQARCLAHKPWEGFYSSTSHGAAAQGCRDMSLVQTQPQISAKPIPKYQHLSQRQHCLHFTVSSCCHLSLSGMLLKRVNTMKKLLYIRLHVAM